MSKATMVVLANCSDPARETEFNDWYTNIHIPDIVALSGFVAATRYRIVGQPSGQPIVSQPSVGQAKYLTFYEIEADDPAAAVAGLREAAPQLAARGRLFDGLQMVYMATYEPITETGGGHVASKGTMVVLANCSDPARETEFNDWYNTHISDIIALVPGFVSAARYRIVGQPGDAQSKYLALYEIEDDDPAAAVARIWETDFGDRGRFDGVQMNYMATYEPTTERITG